MDQQVPSFVRRRGACLATAWSMLWLLGVILAIPYSNSTAFGQANGSTDSPRQGTAQDAPRRVLANLFTGDDRIAAARFHVVLAFDTDHPSHGGALRSLELVKGVVKDFGKGFANVAQNNGQLLPENFGIAANTITITGKDVNRANLLNDVPKRLLSPADPANLSHIQLKKDDVLFFWSETEGNANGELLLAHGPSVTRDEIRNAMEIPDAKGDRTTSLTVFITDNCRTAPGDHDSGNGAPRSNIWRALYFGHTGTIDIASTDLGKPAFASGASFFARAFRNAFDELSTDNGLLTKLDKFPPRGFIEWDREFMDHLQTKTREVFSQEYRKLAVDDYFEANGKPAKKQLGTLAPGKQQVVKAMKQAQGQVPQLNRNVKFSVRDKPLTSR